MVLALPGPEAASERDHMRLGDHGACDSDIYSDLPDLLLFNIIQAQHDVENKLLSRDAPGVLPALPYSQ